MLEFARILAGLAVLSAGLSGCVQTKPATAPATPQPSATAPLSKSIEAAPASRLDASLIYELLLGEFSLNAGDAASASAYVLDAARRTGDAALYKRAVEMAIQSRAGSAALEAVRAWRQATVDSAEAHRYELQVLMALGRTSETAEPLRIVLQALAPEEREAFIIALPALYQRAPDKREAAQTIEHALVDALGNPVLAPAAWTTIGRMRLQASDRAGALAAATLGLDADVRSQWPALLALQLFAGADEPRAEALIKRHLSHVDLKSDVQLGYARALITLGRQADAHTQLANLTRRLPAQADGWLIQGLLYADERADEKAQAALLHYLELAQTQPDSGIDRTPGINQARLTLARLAERLGDTAQAEQWLSQVDAPEQMLAAQIQRAGLLARKGELEQARQLIRSSPEEDADDARLKLMAEAQLLREQGQAAESMRLLSEALRDNPNDDGLLYDAAMSAERLGQTAEMERLLRRVIELKPNAAHAYNALGYALADRGERLNEAKTLIKKAVELSPDDAYIQDSLGWVEFRLGNTQQAREILENAHQRRPDAEIAAHLGEVLWTLGDQAAAKEVWRGGLRLDSANETLTKTLRRFQVQP